MISFLNLIRWPNLIMIIVTMILVLLFVIQPSLNVAWFAIGLSEFQFFLLIISTLFITIGGYLINDFFDMEADRINKPGSNQVGVKFPVATIQVMYWVFTIAGVLFGVWLSWSVKHLNYSLIFVFAAGMLWFYSERYQCIPIVGNLVVAFLSALSFGIVWIYQFFALSTDAYAFAHVQSSFSIANKMVLIYAGFAFIVSLLREILKDIEDVEGDEKYGCNTIAVVYGIPSTKLISIVISILGLAGTLWVQWFFFNAKFWYLFGYFVVIDLMFLLSLIWIMQAKTKSDYKRLSGFMKLLMVIGVLSMLLVYFEM